MTAPQPPSATPEWQQWQVSATTPWAPQAVVSEPVQWRLELVVAAFVVAYSVILGGIVGLVWPRVAPRIYLPKAHPRIVDAVNGSEAASKALLGDDMWLTLLAIIAGIVAVGVLALAARDAGGGPGAAVGLAVGGVLGTLVAAHVGHAIAQPHVVHTLRASFPGITNGSVHTIVGYFGFRLRSRSVLFVWPIVAVILHGCAVALRNQPVAQQQFRAARRRS
jgi:hypothetical protein